MVIILIGVWRKRWDFSRLYCPENCIGTSNVHNCMDVAFLKKKKKSIPVRVESEHITLKLYSAYVS